MSPKRRLVAVSEPFDVVDALARLTGHAHPSMRLAGVYGLSRHSAEPRARLSLKSAEKSDPDAEVRFAAALVLNGFGS